MNDWTGSSKQRKPQGTCEPPKTTASTQSRFEIPAGTIVEVTHISNRKWKPFTTTRHLSFDRYELYSKGKYQFREEDYLLRCPHRLVRKMERFGVRRGRKC